MTSAAGDLQPVRTHSHVPRDRAYGLFVLCSLVALVVAVTLLGVSEGVPPLLLAAFFALLMVITENRDRLFGDETSMSASITVAAASVFAFQGSAPLLGPLVCAACAGLYWPHVRDRSVDKVIVNAASIGFAALAAAMVLKSLTAEAVGGIQTFLLLAIPVVSAYWVVNTLVLAAALSLLRGQAFVRGFLALLRSDVSMLAFAVVGALCGFLMLRNHSWLAVLPMIGLLVLLDLLVISPGRRRLTVNHRLVLQVLRHLHPFVSAIVAGLVAVRNPWVGLGVGVAVGCIVSFLVAFVAMHRRIGVWDQHLALGVAVADLPAIVVAAGGGVLAVSVAIWAGLVFLLAAFGANLVLTRRRRRAIAHTAADDVRVAAAIELAVAEGTDLSSVPR